MVFPNRSNRSTFASLLDLVWLLENAYKFQLHFRFKQHHSKPCRASFTVFN